MNKTDIEYLDYSWNPTHGCSPVSPGCDHCWAKMTSKRLAGMGVRGYSKEDPFKVVCCPWKLDEPLKVKKPSRIGVSFMGDLFHEDVLDDYIGKVLAICRAAQWHTHLILTKRPDRALEFFNNNDIKKYANWLLESDINPDPRHRREYDWDEIKWNYTLGENWPIPNIWLGVTVEHPDYLWRIEKLLQIPAAKRFVSLEPMLGGIDLEEYLSEDYHAIQAKAEWEPVTPDNPLWNKLDWVIVGAESGPKRRECKLEWVRDVVRQCKAAGVPIFVKQLHINGRLSKNMDKWPPDLRVREWPG